MNVAFVSILAAVAATALGNEADEPGVRLRRSQDSFCGLPYDGFDQADWSLRREIGAGTFGTVSSISYVGPERSLDPFDLRTLHISSPLDVQKGRAVKKAINGVNMANVATSMADSDQELLANSLICSRYSRCPPEAPFASLIGAMPAKNVPGILDTVIESATHDANPINLHDVIYSESSEAVAAWEQYSAAVSFFVDTPDDNHNARSLRDLDAVLALGIQALEGLRHIRDRLLVQRDFKGDNTLLSNDGQIRLIDAGGAYLNHEMLDPQLRTKHLPGGLSSFDPMCKTSGNGASGVRSGVPNAITGECTWAPYSMTYTYASPKGVIWRNADPSFLESIKPALREMYGPEGFKSLSQALAAGNNPPKTMIAALTTPDLCPNMQASESFDAYPWGISLLSYLTGTGSIHYDLIKVGCSQYAWEGGTVRDELRVFCANARHEGYELNAVFMKFLSPNDRLVGGPPKNDGERLEVKRRLATILHSASSSGGAAATAFGRGLYNQWLAKQGITDIPEGFGKLATYYDPQNARWNRPASVSIKAPASPSSGTAQSLFRRSNSDSNNNPGPLQGPNPFQLAGFSNNNNMVPGQNPFGGNFPFQGQQQQSNPGGGQGSVTSSERSSDHQQSIANYANWQAMVGQKGSSEFGSSSNGRDPNNLRGSSSSSMKGGGGGGNMHWVVNNLVRDMSSSNRFREQDSLLSGQEQGSGEEPGFLKAEARNDNQRRDAVRRQGQGQPQQPNAQATAFNPRATVTKEGLAQLRAEYDRENSVEAIVAREKRIEQELAAIRRPVAGAARGSVSGRVGGAPRFAEETQAEAEGASLPTLRALNPSAFTYGPAFAVLATSMSKPVIPARPAYIIPPLYKVAEHERKSYLANHPELKAGGGVHSVGAKLEHQHYVGPYAGLHALATPFSKIHTIKRSAAAVYQADLNDMSINAAPALIDLPPESAAPTLHIILDTFSKLMSPFQGEITLVQAQRALERARESLYEEAAQGHFKNPLTGDPIVVPQATAKAAQDYFSCATTCRNTLDEVRKVLHAPAAQGRPITITAAAIQSACERYRPAAQAAAQAGVPGAAGQSHTVAICPYISNEIANYDLDGENLPAWIAKGEAYLGAPLTDGICSRKVCLPYAPEPLKASKLQALIDAKAAAALVPRADNVPFAWYSDKFQKGPVEYNRILSNNFDAKERVITLKEETQDGVRKLFVTWVRPGGKLSRATTLTKTLSRLDRYRTIGSCENMIAEDRRLGKNIASYYDLCGRSRPSGAAGTCVCVPLERAGNDNDRANFLRLWVPKPQSADTIIGMVNRALHDVYGPPAAASPLQSNGNAVGSAIANGNGNANGNGIANPPQGGLRSSSLGSSNNLGNR